MLVMVLGVATVAGGCAKHTVVPLGETKPNDSGLIYTLPRGVVGVDFALERARLKPGTFAEVLLSLTDIPKSDKDRRKKFFKAAQKYFEKRPWNDADDSGNSDWDEVINQVVLGGQTKAYADFESRISMVRDEIEALRKTARLATDTTLQGHARGAAAAAESAASSAMAAAEADDSSLADTEVSEVERHAGQVKSIADAAANPSPARSGQSNLDAACALAALAKAVEALPELTKQHKELKNQEFEGYLYYLERIREHLAAAGVRPTFFAGLGKIEVKSVTVGVTTEPDPERMYVAKLEGGLFVDRTLTMNLTADGLLQDAESEVTDRTVELAVATLETAAGVVVGFGRSAADDSQSFVPASDNPPDLAAFTNPEVRAPYRSLAIALERAETLSKLLKERTNALDGLTRTPNVRPETVALWQKENDKTIEATRGFFRPKPKALTAAARFTFTPKGSIVDPCPAGSCSGLELCETYLLALNKNADRVHANPAYLVAGLPTDWVADGPPANREGDKKYTLTVGRVADGADGRVVARQMSGGSAGNYQEPNGARGFYYRVPGRAEVTLQLRTVVTSAPDQVQTAVLDHSLHPMPQYGPILALPEHTGSLDSAYTLKLHEGLGSIKNVKVVSSALTTEQVGAAGGALTKSFPAEEEADELAELQRRRMILEERVLIQELEPKVDPSDD